MFRNQRLRSSPSGGLQTPWPSHKSTSFQNPKVDYSYLFHFSQTRGSRSGRKSAWSSERGGREGERRDWDKRREEVGSIIRRSTTKIPSIDLPMWERNIYSFQNRDRTGRLKGFGQEPDVDLILVLSIFFLSKWEREKVGSDKIWHDQMNATEPCLGRSFWALCAALKNRVSWKYEINFIIKNLKINYILILYYENLF